MIQRALDFARADRRPVLVRYSQADLEFFATTPLLDLPQSFLLESRAQRMGCSLSELRAMLPYELARELADEVAILGMGDIEKTCRVRAGRLDNARIEAAAKRMAEERAAAFREFCAARKGGALCSHGLHGDGDCESYASNESGGL